MTKFKKGAKKHKKLNKSGLSKEMIEFMSSRPLVINGKPLEIQKNYDNVLKGLEYWKGRCKA